jgi:PAS domain S-box-containing protein
MTERKKAEEERKRTEWKYHNLYSAMNEGCTICEVIFDGAGKAVDFVIRDVNAAYEANTGLARNEVVGRKASELFGKHPFMDIYEKVAVTGKPTSFEGFFPQLKRHLRISAFALERGVFSTIVRDITEEKEAEEEIQAYQGKLKSLASQLTLAEEREKRRIAGELHDQVSQSLAFSKMKLEVLRKSNVPAEAAKTLREVSELIGEVIRDTKSLTFDLSSPMLYERGFEAAVTEWLSEQVERRHGISTEFEDDGQLKPLDNEVQVIVFRDVRELLTNAVKHAHASKVKVSVRRKDEHIEVCVEDNGVGFEPAETSAGSAARSEFGLFSIRERLEQLGGHLEIDSAPGRGCRATVVAPLKVQKKRNPEESEQ